MVRATAIINMLAAVPIGLAVLIAAHVHASDSPLVMPPNPAWTFSVAVAGKMELIHLPLEFERVKELPEADQKSALSEIRRIEDNQLFIRKTGLDFVAKKDGFASRRLIPDYERVLNDVAITVSYADAYSPNPLWRHMPILKALPANSRIHVLMSPLSNAAVKKQLAKEGLASRTRLHLLQPWSREKGTATTFSRQTRWIRDTFLAGSEHGGKPVIYLPLAYALQPRLVESDLSFVKRAFDKHAESQTIPIFVRGGNVAVADNQSGQRHLFVGEDEVDQNEQRYKQTTGVIPPRPLVGEVLMNLSGTRSLQYLPNTKRLFHLDMAVNFIAPGVAAVIKPLDEASVFEEDKAVLAKLRSVLVASGFRIVDIPTTSDRINNFQSPVNMLPYIDQKTQKRHGIVAEFKDILLEFGGKRQSLNALIKAAYAGAGVEVAWAEDRFSDRWGNVHCATLGLN